MMQLNKQLEICHDYSDVLEDFFQTSFLDLVDR